MEHLPTVTANPPAPRPIRPVERWQVSWHARRDAKLPPADEGLPGPYLAVLRAQAQLAQQAVTIWLHQNVVPVDREAVRLLTVLEQFRRDPMTRPSPTLTRVPPDG